MIGCQERNEGEPGGQHRPEPQDARGTQEGTKTFQQLTRATDDDRDQSLVSSDIVATKMRVDEGVGKPPSRP